MKINNYLRMQIIITPKIERNLNNYEVINGVHIYRINVPKFITNELRLIFFILSSFTLLMKLSKKISIDIVQGHDFYSNLAASLFGMLRDVQVVWMFHGILKEYFKKRLYGFIANKKILRVDHIIGLDDGTENYNFLKTPINEKRFTLVTHGIDLGHFKPSCLDSKHVLEMKERLGFKNNFLIISTARFDWWKNVEYTIASFGLFLKKYKIKDALLVLIGRGPLEPYLIELTKKLGMQNKVIFIGYVPFNSIQNYLSISDIFIQTSLYSNMSRSLQEAMAMEKPVLTFNTGGIDKLINNETDGFIVKKGDINKLAEVLFLLYSKKNLRAIIGKNERKRIEIERNWNIRIKKELSIYSSIIACEKKAETFGKAC